MASIHEGTIKLIRRQFVSNSNHTIQATQAQETDNSMISAYISNMGAQEGGGEEGAHIPEYQ
jgi:hypothetical protein